MGAGCCSEKHSCTDTGLVDVVLHKYRCTKTSCVSAERRTSARHAVNMSLGVKPAGVCPCTPPQPSAIPESGRQMSQQRHMSAISFLSSFCPPHLFPQPQKGCDSHSDHCLRFENEPGPAGGASCDSHTHLEDPFTGTKPPTQ